MPTDAFGSGLPWVETIVFGSVADVRRMENLPPLDAAAEPVVQTEPEVPVVA